MDGTAQPSDAGRTAELAPLAAEASSATGEVLRDIARGGIAGAVSGAVVGGLGGRLVMRLAALLHPDAAGAITENGNRIGEITLAGTVALVVFGLIAGVLAGVIWVIVSPWVPGPARLRASLAAVMAIALGSPMLITGTNEDFAILGHDPAVIALLCALIGVLVLAVALVDRWLDGRLPHPLPGQRGPFAVYAAVTAVGATLVLPFVLAVFLTSDEYDLPVRAGYALVLVGLCTAASWVLRARERPAPGALAPVARSLVALAATLGVLTAVPHLVDALGRPF